MMSRKVICDLHLMSVDFGREEERELGNTFRNHLPTRKWTGDTVARSVSGDRNVGPRIGQIPHTSIPCCANVSGQSMGGTHES